MEVSGILEIVKAFFNALRTLLEAFGVLEAKPKDEATTAENA